MPTPLIVIVCLIGLLITLHIFAECSTFFGLGEMLVTGIFFLLFVGGITVVICAENLVEPQINNVSIHDIITVKSKDGSIAQYYDNDGTLVRLYKHFDTKQIKFTEYKRYYYWLKLITVCDTVEGYSDQSK
jgi:hypothetical protein